MNEPDGGLALWVELPEQLSSRRLFDAALAEGILIAPGLMFSNANRCEHFIRMSCGWPYSESVEWAIKRLGKLVGELNG